MSEGRLDFTIGLDIEGLKRNAEQSKKTIEDIGKSATETGGIIDKSFNDKNFGGLYDMRESIKASQEYLQQLKDKYNEVSTAIKNAPLGSDTSQLQADLQAVKAEIDDEETALAGLQARYDTIATQSTPSLRTQIRQLTQTLMQMRLEGNQNTDTYRQLSEQMAKLATVQRQVNKERQMSSSGASQITAWLQGVQALAGAYTVASGAMSLFVKDQEKLVAIQTKLQSLMSVLIGLQQVSNALHSTSALRLKILTPLQNAYNAAVTRTSTSLQAMGLSATAANVAAKALYATLTMGLSIAIMAVISLLSNLFDKQEKVNESLEQNIDLQKAGNKVMVETQLNIQKTIRDLENWNGTQAETDAKVKELNQTYGESFGCYNTLSDWYNVLTQKGEAYINMLIKQAQAQELVNQMIEGANSLTEAQNKLAQEQAKWNDINATSASDSQYQPGIWQRIVLAFRNASDQTGVLQEISAETIATEKRNKQLNEQWAEVKKQQDEVNRIDKENQELMERWKELTAEADTLAKEISAGSTPSTSTTTTTAAGRTTNPEEERLIAIRNTGKLILSVIDEQQKAQIDTMEDGYQKQLAQLDYQYAQELAKIEDYRQQFIELNKQSKVAVGLDGLTDDQRELLAKSEIQLYDKRFKEQKALLDQNLKDIETYEQERERVIREYAARREALYDHDTEGNRTGLREGVTQGNVENLDQQEQQTLQAMEDTLLSRQEWYKQWCDTITSLSIEQLQALMQIAQASLEEMKANGADPETIAQQEAMIRSINDEISKMTTSPNKNSVSDWQKLYKTLNTCEKEFERVGDAIGGTAGDIIKVSGQIASSTLSMFNSLNELSNQFKKSMDDIEKIGKDTTNILDKAGEGAAKATEDAAKGAAGAISTVEKASVILTVISAALSIATAIANLFNNDDKKQKEIDNLQQQIDQLQWELDNTEAVRIQNKLGDALTVVRNIYAETVKEIERMHDASKNYGDTATKSLTKVQKETEAYNKSIQKIADTYANLSYTTTEVLGTEKYSSAREQLENYAEQLKLIQEQYELEDAKKKTDTEQLAEYQQQMDEIAATMSTLVNQLVEEIIGGSAADIASQLGDAFIEAFQAGEDAAIAWGDTVDNIVSNIIKNLLISEIIEPQIGAVFDKYKDLWYDNGEFAGTQAIIASMQDFADDLNAIEGEFADVWDALSESMLDYFTTDSERTGVNQGIATASQESVDELNGRATVIQSHTFSINETTKSMLVTANLILQSIVNIEGHTDGLSTRMATVESYVKEMRDTTNDMYRLGVKIR